MQAVSGQRMVRAGVPDHCGLDCRIHGLRLVAALRIAHESRNLRVRESGGGGGSGIFSGRGSDWSANDCRNVAGSGERYHDYDDTEGGVGGQSAKTAEVSRS